MCTRHRNTGVVSGMVLGVRAEQAIFIQFVRWIWQTHPALLPLFLWHKLCRNSLKHYPKKGLDKEPVYPHQIWFPLWEIIFSWPVKLKTNRIHVQKMTAKGSQQLFEVKCRYNLQEYVLFKRFRLQFHIFSHHTGVVTKTSRPSDLFHT